MDTTKSMLDVAYELMSKSKKETTFGELYDQIAKILTMNDDEKKSHLGEFYTELTLDGRFVALTDNGWDLRARHTYDKVHIDVNDVYSDVEEGDEDEEDEEEEKEFEAQIEGKLTAEAAAPETESEEADTEKPAVDEEVASLVGKKGGEDY
jgi:DNA-directed RNA polymerase subunit delta